MMSSCCTLRLKRRRAFSRDSPSWILTSAKLITPPDWSHLDRIVIARFPGQVKRYVQLFAHVKCSLRHSTCGAPVKKSVSKRRSEEHTSELQSQSNLVCRLLLEKKKTKEKMSCDTDSYTNN